jgi:6-pyruvoyl-tetrahydropterin synthase
MTTNEFTLVFRRRFSMAHRLIAGDSLKCSVPHGHNEFVSIKLEAMTPQPLDGAANMVESFARAKKSWHSWIDGHVDHAFQLSHRDPLIGYFREHEPEKLAFLLITPGDPTTEALAACMMAKANALFAAEGSPLRCVEVEIEETPTNTVIFRGAPEHHLDASYLGRPGTPWWLRGDMTINDL